MRYPSLAKEIINLKNRDLAYRDKLVREGTLYDGYNPEMEKIHIENAERLDQIISEIGYPTEELVGTEASEASWLVIQHSISSPDFMRRCCSLLADAVEKEKASALHLAYLTDRIAVYEDRPQRYGTQYDWDSDGRLSPNPYDDIDLINERRKHIGLNTLEEQTHIMRARAESEGQPPADHEERQKAYDQWRRRVGWVS